MIYGTLLRIIRDALCLSHPGRARDAPETSSKGLPRIKRNIILDAEMVAFSDPLNRIDGALCSNVSNSDTLRSSCRPEFWRIRSLISSTALGVRRKPVAAKATYDSDDDDWYVNKSP